MGLTPSLSHETVRLHLKKTLSSPRSATGQAVAEQEWCISKVSAEFVAHMEEVLDLYAE